MVLRDYPSGAMVTTLCFQSKGCKFYPWLGNKDSDMSWGMTKKKKVVLEEVGWFCPKGIFGKIWRYFWVVTAGIVLLSLSKGLEYFNFLLCTGQLKKNCSAPNVAEIKIEKLTLAFYFQRIQSDGVGWSRNPGLELSLVYSPLPLALKTGVT